MRKYSVVLAAVAMLAVSSMASAMTMTPGTGMKGSWMIGPMGGRQMGTLRWLAEEVIKPLLPDWQVTTPDSSQIGNVRNQSR